MEPKGGRGIEMIGGIRSGGSEECERTSSGGGKGNWPIDWQWPLKRVEFAKLEETEGADDVAGYES